MLDLDLTEPQLVEKPLPKVGYCLPRESFCGLALIGEAPGADEVRLGQPFIGRSGQLLDTMLAEAGINRKACLVANVFRYQPPGNKVDHFFSSRRAAQQAGRALAEDLGIFSSKYCLHDYAGEVAALSEALTAIKPRVIMALGRTPLWALTGVNGLLDKVGTVLPCRLARGVPVIPTYHPSFIVRGNWKLKPAWLEHFIAARDYSGDGSKSSIKSGV